jgi:hypothetical protein
MAGAAVTPDQERSVEYRRPSTTETSVGRASVIAGLALLLMTPIAVFANLFVLDGLVTPGDATGTATAILSAEGTFRLGIASLFAVAILDRTVAWALYTVFKPVDADIALLSGWLRAVFAGIFVLAISQLMSVPQILGATGTGFTTEQQSTQALLSIEAFYNIRGGALILVGLHLMMVGYLLYKSAAVRSQSTDECIQHYTLLVLSPHLTDSRRMPVERSTPAIMTLHSESVVAVVAQTITRL